MATMELEIASFEVDEHRMVEVHRDTTGTYWTGLTTLRSMNDWTFAPREQYGTGPTAEAMATAAAESWAKGLRYDAIRQSYPFIEEY